MKQQFVVEVPVYLRLTVEVDDLNLEDASAIAEAESTAQAYVKEYAPEMRSTMQWPLSPAATLLEHRIVPLCPGEDDQPDVYDASGTVQLN